MDNETNQPSTSGTNWTPTQTYAMAAVCLLIGVSWDTWCADRPPQQTAAAWRPAEMQQAPERRDASRNGDRMPMPTLDDMKRMADKKAEPLLAKLKTDPNNAETLNKTTVYLRDPPVQGSGRLLREVAAGRS